MSHHYLSKSLTHIVYTHTHMHIRTHKRADTHTHACTQKHSHTHTLKYVAVDNGINVNFYIHAGKDLRTPPVVISHPEDQRNAQISSMVKLFCNFSGVPSPAVRWYKDGQDIQFEGNSFTLAAIKPEDRGVYHCVATNERGTAESQGAVVLIQGVLIVKLCQV